VLAHVDWQDLIDLASATEHPEDRRDDAANGPQLLRSGAVDGGEGALIRGRKAGSSWAPWRTECRSD
jgi:hypothetical protein